MLSQACVNLTSHSCSQCRVFVNAEHKCPAPWLQDRFCVSDLLREPEPALRPRSRWRNKKERRPQNHSGWVLSHQLGEQSESQPGSLLEALTPRGRSTAPGKGFRLPSAAQTAGAAGGRGAPGSATTQLPPALPRRLQVATRPPKISARGFCRWVSRGLRGPRVCKEQLPFPLHAGLRVPCGADGEHRTAQQLCSGLDYP